MNAEHVERHIQSEETARFIDARAIANVLKQVRARKLDPSATEYMLRTGAFTIAPNLLAIRKQNGEILSDASYIWGGNLFAHALFETAILRGIEAPSLEGDTAGLYFMDTCRNEDERIRVAQSVQRATEIVGKIKSSGHRGPIVIDVRKTKEELDEERGLRTSVIVDLDARRRVFPSFESKFFAVVNARAFLGAIDDPSEELDSVFKGASDVRTIFVVNHRLQKGKAELFNLSAS